MKLYDDPLREAYRAATYGMLSWNWRRRVRRFLARGGDLAAYPGDGTFSVLHTAACTQRVEAIRWLVEHGAPINATTWGGRTPLHIAVSVACRTAQRSNRMPDFQMARTLLQLGAHPYMKDGNGRTPRDIVAGCELPILARYDAIVYAAWAVGE